MAFLLWEAWTIYRFQYHQKYDKSVRDRSIKQYDSDFPDLTDSYDEDFKKFLEQLKDYEETPVGEPPKPPLNYVQLCVDASTEFPEMYVAVANIYICLLQGRSNIKDNNGTRYYNKSFPFSSPLSLLPRLTNPMRYLRIFGDYRFYEEIGAIYDSKIPEIIRPSRGEAHHLKVRVVRQKSK